MALLANLIATVVSVFGGKATAKASFGDRMSDVLPVATQANSFKRHFVPRRVDEQVVVVGSKDSGVIVGNLFHEGCKEPKGSSDTCEVVEYENGGRITIDTASGVITFSGFKYVLNGDTAINGDLSVSGDTNIDGNISGGSNITAAGIISDSDGNNGA